MAEVGATLEQYCTAPVPDVWRVIVEPELSSTVDPRVSLVSASGTAGTPGSTYQLDLHLGGTSLRQQVEVVDADPPWRWVSVSTMSVGAPTTQTAQLRADGEGTLLSWTVSTQASWLWAFFARRHIRRELGQWLEGLARRAERLSNPPSPPQLVAIDHDDYHARYVGRLPDGRQFFLTAPFEPAGIDDPGEEFSAVYLFDADGGLLEARIESAGPRSGSGPAGNVDVSADDRLRARLDELGEFTFGRIEVRPFAVERFDRTFGLVARTYDDGRWTVELEPGNYMAFSEPWGSGEYDT